MKQNQQKTKPCTRKIKTFFEMLANNLNEHYLRAFCNQKFLFFQPYVQIYKTVQIMLPSSKDMKKTAV